MTSAPLTHVGRFTVPADHPCLPGHFPGRPLAPGVVLLDHVSALLAARHPGWRLLGLPRVKFTHPVLPGDEVEVDAGPGTEGRIPFQCRANGRDVLNGVAAMGPA